MRALLDDFAIGQNQNTIGHSNGGKAVRNQNGHLIAREIGEPQEHFIFGAGVQTGGRFVGSGANSSQEGGKLGFRS
jgi:hypothetical protein